MPSKRINTARVATPRFTPRQGGNQNMSRTRVEPWRVGSKKNPEHQLPPCFLPLLRVSTPDGLKTYLVQSQWTSSFIASVCIPNPKQLKWKTIIHRTSERAKMQAAKNAKETAANAVASAKCAVVKTKATVDAKVCLFFFFWFFIQ